MPYLPAGATLLDVFKRFPDTNAPLIEFHEALLRAPPFTEAERELIATYVSGLNRCRYCRGVHTATAERLGVPTHGRRWRRTSSTRSPSLSVMNGFHFAPILPRKTRHFERRSTVETEGPSFMPIQGFQRHPGW
ncbi:carboxymuconolactone decarboxylase family protein [Chelativorans sp. M5D2P16]|uniref:carboxymuconolactone decarboxylase family protein n=1 Tax=Chelativorans sp. M5D2P16 TaxID=3095678 RepID=UPI002ACA7DE5|nr:carboxymuconolactone decarboxylase family protein [Chelativorans sp. M5D2P16]MDZ5696765.1 carboxymuconolactone decarboxylase family protein [Chelativorans sp. M5D2P16]